MSYRRVTVIFILLTIAAITVFDVWAALRGYDWTISATLLAASKERPIIPFLCGVVAGHLFWVNNKEG